MMTHLNHQLLFCQDMTSFMVESHSYNFDVKPEDNVTLWPSAVWNHVATSVSFCIVVLFVGNLEKICLYLQILFLKIIFTFKPYCLKIPTASQLSALVLNRSYGNVTPMVEMSRAAVKGTKLKTVSDIPCDKRCIKVEEKVYDKSCSEHCVKHFAGKLESDL